MPELNIPLARKVLDHITHHPDEFEMDYWAHRTACGTTLCIAGHAVHLAGHQIRWESCRSDDGSPTECGDDSVYATCLEDGRSIEAVAAEELGLSNATLFHSSNKHAPKLLANLIKEAEDFERRQAVSNA